MSTAERLSHAKRIVVKIGSSSITGANEHNLDQIVDFVAEQMAGGQEVIVVSSGAIATAAPLIGLAVKSDDLATSQALASIGQARLMGRYERSLARHNLIPGQILLTVDNLDDEQPRTNASRSLERLLEIGVVPIINENDSVATQEIRFGDNDRLASRVSLLARADLLILLSDVDSLYSRPPQEEGAERISSVRQGDDLSHIQVSGTSTGYGTGGALTKLAAARYAAEGGVGVILTATELVGELAKGSPNHTWFEPNAEAVS